MTDPAVVAARFREARESLPAQEGVRKKKGSLSRVDLGHQIGVVESTIQKWEREGPVGVGPIVELARLSGFSLDYLFGLVDTPVRRRTMR